MIFRRKKEDRRRTISFVDYRIGGYDLFRVMFISTIIVLFVAWTSVLLLSLLYLFSFVSLIILLVYGINASRHGVRFGGWFLAILATALFFFALSLNSSDVAYLIGAYGSSLSSPIAAYPLFLRDLREKRELAEEFGYE